MGDTGTQGKAKRPSREARQEAILAAARSEFEQRGYERTKVADIASRIGVVEGTVFHHFGNKRELVLRVMERFYEEATAVQAQGLQGIEGLRNRLHYIIRFHLANMVNNASLCGVILRESRGLDRALTRDIRKLNQAYTEPFRQVLKEGVDSGELRADLNIPRVRDMVYGGIEHALWNLLNDDKPIDIDRAASDLTAVTMQGIAAPQSANQNEEAARLMQQLNALLEKT